MKAFLTLFGFYILLLVSPLSGLPSPGEVEETIRRANDYYQATVPAPGKGDWLIGAYQTGNMAAAEVLQHKPYFDRALAFGEANEWKIGAPWPVESPYPGANTPRLHADSHAAGQTYLDLYQRDPSQPVRKAEIKAAMDDLVGNVPWSDRWGNDNWADDDWGWVDAFYMAGPTLARMANIENGESYRRQLRQMYAYMKEERALFDPAEGLWYRDGNSKTEESPNGEKVFWSRGNGWVMGGLVRVLEQLPEDHPDRAEFEATLQAMAAALEPLQGEDGFWRSNLKDPGQYPNPETSGTGFFCYAMAWGIRNDILATEKYLPVVESAWRGLSGIALRPSGLVGYIQDQGRAPAPAGATETHPYGVGAFLLAGTEVLRLAGGPGPVLAFAGNGQSLNAGNDQYEADFVLDAGGSRIRRGEIVAVSWWAGEAYLAEGWTTEVRLPRGTHTLTLRMEHSNGKVYEDTVEVRLIPPSEEIPVAAVIASTDDGNIPANTVDGSFSTRWSANGDGQWIRWDLGNTRPVSEIRLAWFRGDQRTAFFDIEVSNDGAVWEKVLTNQVASGTTVQLESFPFPAVEARYIRYLGFGNSDGNGWNSITEAELASPAPGKDADEDGLPDSWEIARTGTTAFAPEEDPFGKGIPLRSDFVAGTNPRQPADLPVLRMEPTQVENEFRCSFQTSAAFGPGYEDRIRHYTLQSSPDLSPGSWSPVSAGTDIVGNNLQAEIPVTLSGDKAYYRVIAELK